MSERRVRESWSTEDVATSRASAERSSATCRVVTLALALLLIPAFELGAGEPSIVFDNDFDGGGTQGWSATVPSTCTDGIETDDETDVDCGGGSCPSCSVGQGCESGGDCATTLCLLGICVDCAIDSDCPGEDTECATPFCSSGTCAITYESFGTQLAAQDAGDCRVWICDGAGGVSSGIDDSDIPVDGTICTDGFCSAGTPFNLPANEGDECEEPGDGGICESGVCVPAPL